MRLVLHVGHQQIQILSSKVKKVVNLMAHGWSNVVDVQLPLPFSALFNGVAQNKYLVHASLCFAKTCLLLLESLVHCFLLRTDRRVTPLQLLQLLRAPFFGIFMMTPSSCQVVVSPPILLQRGAEELVLQAMALP